MNARPHSDSSSSTRPCLATAAEQRRVRRIRTLALALAGAALLAACGSGGDDAGSGGTAPPPPPPPSGNQAPVASFTASAAAAAGAPVRFDASASRDADGDTLSYRWSFGDGTLGGGDRIAHTFAAGGTYTVALTVDDGKGGRTRVEQTVTVSSGASATAVVNTLARVRDLIGQPLAGVTVSASVPTPGVPGTPSAVTGADGEATLATGTGVPVVLKFSKPGYADQWRNASLPVQAGSGWLEVVMQPRETALVLASAAAGGTLVGRDGATVVFEPGSLVDAAGNPVTGPVQVSMTPVDVGRNVAAFPGRFSGTRPTGETGLIVSYGTVEYALSAGGAPVQLAPGRKATIEIPVYTTLNLDGSEVRVGDRSPLWSLNELTGGWTEEGSGTVVASTASPSGFALRAEVTHFSWWNHDAWTGPGSRPKPRCKVDTNADGVLEDLTDTGHCFHIGTGMDIIDSLSGLGAGGGRMRMLGASALADAPAERRLPAFAAYDSTPVNGGKVLEIPANAFVTFRSYAKDGTLFGMKTVNLGPGVEQDVDIVLAPIQGNPGTLAITLPYDRNFLLTQAGETDAFTFAASGSDQYEVKVEAAPGSRIAGSVQLLDGSQQAFDGGTFGSTGGGYIGIVPGSVSGTVTVRVTASSRVPGAYRITVRRITTTTNDSCLNPPALTLDAPALPIRVLRANSVECWSLALGAGELVEIRNQQVFDGANGFITLRAPDGRVLASDPYGADRGPNARGMLLRLGVVEAGTYRVEISNTVPQQATFQGLEARRLTGVQTLGASGSLTLTDVNGPSGVRRLVALQPAVPGEAFALLTQGPAAYTVFPAQQTTTAGNPVEILTVQAAAGIWPVVEFTRAVTTTATPVVVSQAPLAPLALDNTINGTGPAAGGAAALVFDATAGSEISWGFANNGASTGTQLRLVAPSGRGLGGEIQPNQLVALPESGRYTLGVYTPASASPSGYVLRVNRAPAPVALTPTPTVTVEGSLELGQVLRWTLPVQSTDVFAQMRVQPNGGSLGGVLVLRQGASFIDRHRSIDPPTGPLWATTDATWTFTLSTLNSSGGTLAQKTGPYRITLVRAQPQPLALDQPFDATIGIDQALLLTTDPGATTPVRYCLRTQPSGAALDLFNRGWQSEPAPVNAGDDTTLRHGIGTMAAQGNRLLLLGRAASTLSLRITPNPTPATLQLGAAAVPGSAGTCRSGYHRFAGTPSTSYTARIDAPFDGTVRVYFQNSGVDWVGRGLTASGLTRALTAGGGITNHVFTVPSNFSAGTWVIEVEAAQGASGNYTVQLTSP